MVKVSSIKPLSDFVRNTKSHIEYIRSTGEPEILTVNGEAAIVVQDASAYEEMSALAEQARQDTRLLAALEHFRKGGKGKAAEKVFAKLKRKHL